MAMLRATGGEHEQLHQLLQILELVQSRRWSDMKLSQIWQFLRATGTGGEH